MIVICLCVECGVFLFGIEYYGCLLLGVLLIWFFVFAVSCESGLILVGIYGDENFLVVMFFCVLWMLIFFLCCYYVVLCVNFDGCQLGLWVNVNGVDLNRNFLAVNWKEGEIVYCWNSVVEECDVVLLIGDKFGFEFEIQVLCQFIYCI